MDDSVHNTVSRRPVQPSRPEAGLRLDDGRVVSVGTGVAIGRSPTPTTGLASVPIDDLSLSRTHASITPSDNGVWVTDLHSTNGVTIDLPTGTVGCVPGVRVEAPLGSRLHLGDVVVAVVAV